jgi:hypothetical protein
VHDKLKPAVFRPVVIKSATQARRYSTNATSTSSIDDRIVALVVKDDDIIVLAEWQEAVDDEMCFPRAVLTEDGMMGGKLGLPQLIDTAYYLIP